MKTAAALVFSALLFASVGNATITRLPGATGSPYIGTSIPITAGWWIGDSSENVDGGGVFAGTVKPTTSPKVYTAFWCVDDQTYFTPSSTSALANITLLSNLGGGLLGQTEYAAANGKFTLSDPTGGAGDTIPNDPQTRLLMAAYLITQYGGYTTSPFSQLPVDNLKSPGGNSSHGTNADVQDAIWAITNNGAFTSATGHTGPGTHGVGSDNVKYWINQALSHYGSVDGNEWALVTWEVGSTGVVTSPQQNFLVALNPEPGFYGALALGLSGLALVVSRKRKSA